MPLPDYQTLMLPVLRLAATGEVRASSAVDSLAAEFALSEDERAEPMPSGRGNTTLFSNRVHWAVTYLVHAGLLERPRRAHFMITGRGREVLARGLDRIDNNVLKEFVEFNAWISRSQQAGKDRSAGDSAANEPSLSSTETPLERIESDYQALLSTLKEDLLERVLGASPAFFEGLIVNLLVAMGYGGSRKDAAKAIGRSGDEGIDGIINEDRLGLDIVYLQAKRYQTGNNIGRPAVQAFAGSLDGFGATKGVFVTTSAFSRDAQEYAERITKRIVLIDGQELTRLMVQYGVGVRPIAVYEVNRIDEDFFDA